MDNRVLKSQIFRSVSGSARITYMYLAQYRNNETGEAYPCHQTLANDTGFAVATIRTHIAALVKAGLIAKVQRVGTSNLYTFRYDGLGTGEGELVESGHSQAVNAKPAKSGAEISAEALSRSPDRVVVQEKQKKTYAPKPRVDLDRVAECKARRDRFEYAELSDVDRALAVWYDSYAIHNNYIPSIVNWGMARKASKRLFQYLKGDIDRIIQWVEGAFELAISRKCYYHLGISGVSITSLLQESIALQIRAHLEGEKSQAETYEPGHAVFRPGAS